MLKGGLVVAGGLFAAQLAGFARQAAIASFLGTGPEADALSAAMAPIDVPVRAATATARARRKFVVFIYRIPVSYS